MTQRILFLCARGSSRSLLAASLFSGQAANNWEVWCTPTQDMQGLHLAEQVLSELGIPLIGAAHQLQPAFGMQWDEGIILCSGVADT